MLADLGHIPQSKPKVEKKKKQLSEKIKKEAEEIAKGTQYEKILQGKDGKYADGSEI